MAIVKESNRLKLSGAIFGVALGAALALVQVTLFMMGTTDYNVSTTTASTLTTAGSSEFTGFILLPLLLVVGFGALGAFVSDRYAKRMQAPASRFT